MMYDQHQHQQHQQSTEFPKIRFTSKNLTPRRLPPLNLFSSLSFKASPITSSPTRKAKPNRRPTEDGYKAQLEVKLQYERQHAFEVSLEQMLMEVENGSDWKKEENQKKTAKKTKNNEERPPGWQKIWYKRLG